MIKSLFSLASAIIISICIPFITAAQQTKTLASKKNWLNTSDHYTQMLIDLDEKFSPENSSSQGLVKYDTLISIPTLANVMAERKDEEALLITYQKALKTEKEVRVIQDLNILTDYLKLRFRKQDFALKHKISFENAASIVYDGIAGLLDDQTPAERRPAAVARIIKYAGLAKGYIPITTILQEQVLKQISGKDMIYPLKKKMEDDLSHNSSLLDGISELCRKYKLKGWEEPYAKLRKQIEDYDQWAREHVLTNARTDFRLSPEEYSMALETHGIDISPAELVKTGHTAFIEIQNQMKPIAAQIARQRHLSSANYQDVIRELKKEQLYGDSIVPVYESRLKYLEGIIREHHLITLPNRPAIIRLATAAESAQLPVPYMAPPPLLNNTGQSGIFVLPLNERAAPGEKSTDKFDDFAYNAASWTIAAHEGRPGHELQFDRMVEVGVSKARALYADNTTNEEGWAVYSEYITRPYMPLEGRLISLDYLLLRAAHNYLDPGLQAGTVTQEQAFKILTQDVGLSVPFAKIEVNFYTIKSPGRANSYFYGFTSMLALRTYAQKALGSKFSELRFHDFIISQGLLTPKLLKKAVMNEFVPAEKNR